MRSSFFRKLLRNNRGATAIEYGLIVSLIVIAMIAALDGVANENTGLWARVKEKVTTAP
jgi:pilus assembly protein Flp/PilA